MMKQAIIFLLLGCLMLPARAQNKSENMDRIDLCKQNYTALFGGEALTGEGTDPEFMAILQKFIFGEVFAVGDLDRPTRELITCTFGDADFTPVESSRSGSFTGRSQAY